MLSNPRNASPEVTAAIITGLQFIKYPKEISSKLVKSTPVLLWLLFFFIMVDLFLVAGQPMRYVHVPGIIFKQQDHIDFKVQSVLSPSKPFNTLLMGSSLAEAAAINADVSLGLAKPTDYTAARYNHATFLDQLSERKFQKKSTTFSSAIGGSMISDQQLILEKVFAKKKYPQNVLLIIEPRAFIDATRTPELYPVACYMKWRYKDIANLKNTNDGMDYVFSSFWTYFKYRSDFFTLATC